MQKKRVQVLSFAAGLVLAAAVLGVTVRRNPAFLREVERQFSSILKTTKSLAASYKNVASKVSAASNLIREEKTAVHQEASATPPMSNKQQWDEVEAQLYS